MQKLTKTPKGGRVVRRVRRRCGGPGHRAPACMPARAARGQAGPLVLAHLGPGLQKSNLLRKRLLWDLQVQVFLVDLVLFGVLILHSFCAVRSCCGRMNTIALDERVRTGRQEERELHHFFL